MTATRRSALAGLTTLAAAGASVATAATKPKASGPDTKTALKPYAVNLDLWYRKTPFLERFALAARDGFTFVEFWPVNREGSDATKVRALLDQHGLTCAQYAPGAPAFGDPAKHDELITMIKQAIADCRTLNCTKITLVGHANVKGMTREDMLVGYTAGLMRIAPLLEDAGVMALVEPFNQVNHLNFLLNGSRPALGMCRAVKSPMVKLQWDFYHMQLEEGDLIERFAAGIDQVGYVQLGDVPGRHQPGTGEVNHVNLLKAIRAAGYTGPMGLEYAPKDDDDAKAVKDAVELSVAAGLV